MTGTSKDPRLSDPPARPPAARGPSGAEFAGLGVQFVVSIVAGMYGGQWLDRKFGIAPWGLVGGVFLAAALSFVSMYRRLMAAQARDTTAAKLRSDTQR